MRKLLFLSVCLCLGIACETGQPSSSTVPDGNTDPVSPAPNTAPQFRPDPQLMQPFESYFRILQDTIETGTMRVNCTLEADGWILEEYSTLEVAKVREIIRTKLDLRTLYPMAQEVQGIIDGQPLDVRVAWTGTKIEGYSEFPRPAHKPQGHLTINETPPAGTVERTGTFYTLPHLPLAEGYSIRFPWFNALYGDINYIHLVVSGSEQVRVPAGTFDTWRVVLNGGEPTQYVYVTKSSPRRVVKIGVEGLPWSFELI